MGVGTSKGIRGVRWGVARMILLAWFITIPFAAIAGGLAWVIIHTLGLVA